MKIRLKRLIVRTKKTIEEIEFSDVVTFLYGPVGTGKSTVARLVDYCLGGALERTPAIQQEFVSAELSILVGEHDCTIERGADDGQAVTVTWSGPSSGAESLSVPLKPQTQALLEQANVYNLSDLIFHLCGTTPIRVRQRARDRESPLIRLSIRDLWWYCYLEQIHLDSSFFHLDDPFKGRKSQDAMRFITGLHSERLNQLEIELLHLTTEQQAKREAVEQIRKFMEQFDLGTEMDVARQLDETRRVLDEARGRQRELEQTRRAQIHPTDGLRGVLRDLGSEIELTRQAMSELSLAIQEQQALRAELITAKTKAARANQASRLLEGVKYERCPECGSGVSDRAWQASRCRLCGSRTTGGGVVPSLELEALRRDFNERIEQIGDSIDRRKRALSRMETRLVRMETRKVELDNELQVELERYDSAYVESMRGLEREMATLVERMRSMKRLQQMPQAIDSLQEAAGALQGRIDQLRHRADQERDRLKAADANVAAIGAAFKRIMLGIGFPGVSNEDQVMIDPRNWKPVVAHRDQEWSFWDAGSGGKKTLFNVCYALAIHAVARERGLSVPEVLIIDSPTKNISEDENPRLVKALYEEIYRLSVGSNGVATQFVLIDSELVGPDPPIEGFVARRFAGEDGAPSLIPYYKGP